MAVTVTCRCGASYNLKDEFSGKTVQCPRCGEILAVPALAPRGERLDPAFDREKFLLRQKHLSVKSQKYYVGDENGQPILYVERPYHHLRSIAAALAGLFAALLVGIFLGIVAASIEEPTIQGILIALAIVGGIGTLFAVAVPLSQKRHIAIYRDDSKTELLLGIEQDRKLNILTAPYTVREANGQVLARLRKNYLYDFFRKRWYCFDPDGQLLCVAKEDSLILSLIRRFLGTFFGILRTNFVILAGHRGPVVGEFNRKFTLLDRYVLDMTSDTERKIDRRVAVALGVMLDTGERR